MALGITRERALELLQTHIENKNMIKHCLASEAVLGAIAEHLGADKEKWAMAGLLHDLDVEITNADLTIHGTKSGPLLRKRICQEQLHMAQKQGYYYKMRRKIWQNIQIMN